VLDKLELWGKLPVLFSPSYGEVQPQDLAQWVLQSGKPARLQLQLHKLIWGAEKRGV
jgi:7-carboxy-7-deazaguanine synthase